MTDVRPFRGLRYNPYTIEDLSSVITPPYDVITEKQQNDHYERHPHNLIRLELGKEYPEDGPAVNRYTRAAEALTEWIRTGVMIREQIPAYYLVEHKFSRWGQETSYWGLVAAVKLEDFESGEIRPTEIVMKGPVADRLQLLRSCKANLSPIMAVYRRNEPILSLFPEVDPANPTVSATDDDGVTFNLHVIADEARNKQVTDFFAGTPLYIADGHHRYTTALAYRNEQPEKDYNNVASPNFAMITLIGTNDPGLTLFPTHRMLRGLPYERLAKLKTRLQERFQIRELPPVSSAMLENAIYWNNELSKASQDSVVFGLFGLNNQKYLLLTPHDVDSIRETLPHDKPPVWRELDVSLLHNAILQDIMDIDDLEKEKRHLTYSPDAVEILKNVATGEAQLGIFLNPVPVSDVLAVADAGVRMPPKSTYFYPKTAGGLVIHSLFE